jgi:diguanylate cyclase (GGDEF)-like protein/PAS domain S-box-containing protein
MAMTQAPSPPETTPFEHVGDDWVRAVFESSPDGIVLLASDGRILGCNPSFLRLWGFGTDMLQRADPVEMRAHTARQLREPQAYLDSIGRLFEQDRPVFMDEVALLDGRVFERHVSPLRRADRIAGVVVRWRDVTQRRQAQTALQATQTRLTALFDHALNAILLADNDGRYLDGNPAALQLLGLGRDDLLSLRISDVVVAGSATVDETWSSFLDERRSRGVIQVRRADGRVRTVSYSAVADIQPGVHLSVLSDITDERASQERQGELRTLMELAMRISGLAGWQYDPASQSVSALNDLARSLMPGPGAQCSLEAWRACLHPEDRDAHAEYWRLAISSAVANAPMATQTPASLTVRWRLDDTQDWTWLSETTTVVPVPRPGGTLVRLVGTWADISVRMREQAELQRLAWTDALTGAANRRRFMEVAADRLQLAARSQEPVAILMLDLDFFKAINDGHGHAAGDHVLQHFASSVRAIVREVDLFGRLGGEEFALLLYGSDAQGASHTARRLQDRLAEQPPQWQAAPLRYTVSVGVASSLAESRKSLDALLKQADAALYAAKTGGRNRVVCAPGEGAAQPAA